MYRLFLPITEGHLERDGRKVIITFVLSSGRADELEASWKEAQEKTCCPSCHILWEQTRNGPSEVKRHISSCRWPEIVMERNRSKIEKLQAKNANILENNL